MGDELIMGKGITLVACIDMNLGLGDEKGNLLYKLPKDMENFKTLTDGKIVVMGRKTWDSLPKKPLIGRKNYVMTRDTSFDPKGAKVISFDKVLEMSKLFEIIIIGGGDIYSQFIPYANKMIITHVHDINQDATTFFPDFSYEDWSIEGEPIKHEADSTHKSSFSFVTYNRIEN